MPVLFEKMQEIAAIEERRRLALRESVCLRPERGCRHPDALWEAIGAIAAKIGCSGETLREWVRQAERDHGLRAGPASTEQARIKALEREVRELRQANKILRRASAYFAMAELDRRSKP